MEAVYFCFSVYFVKITPFATNASTLVNMTEIVNPFIYNFENWLKIL